MRSLQRRRLCNKRPKSTSCGGLLLGPDWAGLSIFHDNSGHDRIGQGPHLPVCGAVPPTCGRIWGPHLPPGGSDGLLDSFYPFATSTARPKNLCNFDREALTFLLLRLSDPQNMLHGRSSLCILTPVFLPWIQGSSRWQKPEHNSSHTAVCCVSCSLHSLPSCLSTLRKSVSMC